jgi:hypothetical protein
LEPPSSPSASSQQHLQPQYMTSSTLPSSVNPTSHHVNPRFSPMDPTRLEWPSPSGEAPTYDEPYDISIPRDGVVSSIHLQSPAVRKSHRQRYQSVKLNDYHLFCSTQDFDVCLVEIEDMQAYEDEMNGDDITYE